MHPSADAAHTSASAYLCDGKQVAVEMGEGGHDWQFTRNVSISVEIWLFLSEAFFPSTTGRNTA